MKKNLAELIGTFWLVFGGCGSALLAAAFPQLGIGFAGVSLAFGLTVLTIAYSFSWSFSAPPMNAPRLGLRASPSVLP